MCLLIEILTWVTKNVWLKIRPRVTEVQRRLKQVEVSASLLWQRQDSNLDRVGLEVLRQWHLCLCIQEVWDYPSPCTLWLAEVAHSFLYKTAFPALLEDNAETFACKMLCADLMMKLYSPLLTIRPINIVKSWHNLASEVPGLLREKQTLNQRYCRT